MPRFRDSWWSERQPPVHYTVEPGQVVVHEMPSDVHALETGFSDKGNRRSQREKLCQVDIQIKEWYIFVWNLYIIVLTVTHLALDEN